MTPVHLFIFRSIRKLAATGKALIRGRQRRSSNTGSCGSTSSQLRGAPCKALLAGWAWLRPAAGKAVSSINRCVPFTSGVGWHLHTACRSPSKKADVRIARRNYSAGQTRFLRSLASRGVLTPPPLNRKILIISTHLVPVLVREDHSLSSPLN